ncbi:MAG: hypothetical protein WD360_06705 [Nitriliruptoraceae bacterium]
MRKARRGYSQSPPKASLAPDGHELDAVLAASIIVLRDGPFGLETLLLERPQTAVFAPGALVFPGGKVNPDDGALAAFHARGVSLTNWQQQLKTQTPVETRALLFAAVRETFEETGVLLACDHTGTPMAQERTQNGPLAQLRHITDATAAAQWTEVLAHERLLIDVDCLTLVSWWVTPHGYPRRFDTRFFAVRLPAGSTVIPASGEIVSTLWLAPQTALEQAQSGRRHIIYPTRKNLAQIAPYITTNTALAALKQTAPNIRRLCPQLIEVDGITKVMHPDGGEPEDE